jgi:hypothetical protein
VIENELRENPKLLRLRQMIARRISGHVDIMLEVAEVHRGAARRD